MKSKNAPDGTGIVPSVNEGNAQYILDYIHNVLNYKDLIVDCGTGLGLLVKFGNGQVIGIEGNADLFTKRVCEHNILYGDLLDHDFMNSISKVGLCTAFEVIEHIHEDDILNFFKNIHLISDELFCSIHIGTTPIPGHILIKSEDWWNNFFEQNKIKYTKLTDFEINWYSSLFYLLNLNQLDNNE